MLRIADSFSIICFLKKGSIPVFSHFVKTTKIESETLYTVFSAKSRFICISTFDELINRFCESSSLKTPKCHPSFFREMFRDLDSNKARIIGLFDHVICLVMIRWCG